MLQKQVMFFKHKPCNKELRLDKSLKNKIRKISDRTNYVSCLRIKIDENLNWKLYVYT